MYARVSILEKRTENFLFYFSFKKYIYLHLHLILDFVIPNSIQLPLLIEIIELLIILKNDDYNI